MNRQQKFIAQVDAKCGTGECVQYGGDSATSPVNVGKGERLLSTIAGGMLVKRNLGRFSLGGIAKLAAGAALIRRGITGHCNMYEAMHVSMVKPRDNNHAGASETAIPVHAEMKVDVPPMQAYELWRDPANQRWIMGHFAKVDLISMDRAHWKLRGPFGLEWDALVVAESPGEYISWETLPGAGLPNEGVVRFIRTESGGTRVLFEARFEPPSTIVMTLCRAVGITPESVIGKALYRFKSMAEMEPIGSRPRAGQAQQGGAVPATT